jgi:hypothetical protein
MTNIYIDPAWGKPLAFALFVGGEALSVGSTVNMDDALAKIRDSDMVFCEDQFPGRMSWESGKKLIRSTGWIECMAHLCGKPFYLVNPQAWKRHHGLAKKYESSVLWKLKVALAKEYAPIGDIENKWWGDKLDALLMGVYCEWCISRYGLESGLLRAPGIAASAVAYTPARSASSRTTKSRIRYQTGNSTGT